MLGFWITPVWYTAGHRPEPVHARLPGEPDGASDQGAAEAAAGREDPASHALGYVAIAACIVAALGYLIFGRLRQSAPEHL